MVEATKGTAFVAWGLALADAVPVTEAGVALDGVAVTVRVASEVIDTVAVTVGPGTASTAALLPCATLPMMSPRTPTAAYPHLRPAPLPVAVMAGLSTAAES